MPSPSRVAASAARIFSRRYKVLVGLLEELERVGVAFRSATEPIDTSTPTGDREKPWEVRQRRLLDSLETFAAGYTEDASVIQPGVYEKDREEIRANIAAAFAGPLSGSRVAARPVDVRFLTGGTAIVVSEDGTIFAGQGAVASERLVRASWVLVRRDGGWRIASYHNSPAS